MLIVASFALFALEAKLQTHGVIGIGGIILMVLGALLLVDGPIPELRVRLWAALAVAIPIGLITVFLMSIALKARKNKVVTGEQGMIGEIALACSPLAPSGRVFVHGELWDAVASVPVAAGSQVIVRSVRESGIARGSRGQHRDSPIAAGLIFSLGRGKALIESMQTSNR